MPRDNLENAMTTTASNPNLSTYLYADSNAQPGTLNAEVLAAVTDFCQRALAPEAAHIDQNAAFAGLHRPKLAAMGLMGINLPATYGGSELNAHTLFACIAAVAGACASTASMLTAHFLATDSLKYGASAQQKQQWLPPAANGEHLGSFALSEPAAGSNPAEMTTTATLAGEAYHLKGVKHFISNAAHADFLIVYAKTDRDAAAKGISAFYVDAKQPGIAYGAPERTMGLRGGHVFEVSFDTHVPRANLLGIPGKGLRLALQVLDAGRLDIAACCVGIAQAALNAALVWAKTRHIDARPISDKQGITWMLSDMAVDLAAAQALADRANQQRDAGEPFSMASSIAKLYASEMVSRVTDRALQIHGGYGYMSALPLERYVRDARIMRIYEGSSEIQRNIIARALLQD